MIEIEYGQIDPNAKADITGIAAPDRKSWATLADLRRDDEWLPGYYGTLEHNQFLLDGELEIFPDSTAGLSFGWWNDTLSGADGVFAAPPTLEIEFGTNHKSRGLTLYFYPDTEDYPTSVRVSWFDAQGRQIFRKVFELTGTVAVVDKSVMDYARIQLEFLSTNLPYRNVKLYAITFGITRTFEDWEIDGCEIMEEINPIADSLSANSLEFSVKVDDPIFSPVSGELADDMMMTQQWIRVASDEQPFGVFFLNEWEDVNQSGAEFRFRAEDALAVLEQYAFYSGIYENKLVAELVREIVRTAFPTGLVGYSLAPALAERRVSGWLPVGNCREALLQLCFAIQAVADTSRGGQLRIFERQTSEPEMAVTLHEIYQGGKIRPTSYYSGVELVSRGYQQSEQSVTAYQGRLAGGEHRLTFKQPLHSLSITGGTIVASGANYADVRVVTSGDVTLSGKIYAVAEHRHQRHVPVRAGQVDNLAVFDEGTLVQAEDGERLTGYLLEYLEYKLLVESKLLLGELEVARMVRLATYGRDVLGVVERLEIDLRARTATATVVGSVDPIDPFVGLQIAALPLTGEQWFL